MGDEERVAKQTHLPLTKGETEGGVEETEAKSVGENKNFKRITHNSIHIHS